jgi:hypothetical protein
MVMNPVKGGYKECWRKQRDYRGEKTVQSPRDLGKYMSREKYEEISRTIRFNGPADPAIPLAERDPYHPVRTFVDEFNKHRVDNVIPGPALVIDECMSSWTGVEDKYSADGCPGKTYITRKPRPFGVELKAVCCGVSNICLQIEIQEGKERMRAKQFVAEYGVTTATTLRLLQPWGGSKRYAVGDSWFGSVKCEVALHTLLGLFCIFIVKTAHTMFPLQHLKNWGATLSKQASRQRQNTTTQVYISA